MSKTGKKPLAILVFIGVIIVLNGLFTLISDLWLMNYGKMAAGVCAEVSYSRRSSSAVVQYEVDGQLYAINTGAGGMSEGSTAVIHYPEGSPEDGRIIDLKGALLEVMVGAVVALVGWKGKWNGRKGFRLSRGKITFFDRNAE